MDAGWGSATPGSDEPAAQPPNSARPVLPQPLVLLHDNERYWRAVTYIIGGAQLRLGTRDGPDGHANWHHSARGGGMEQALFSEENSACGLA